MSSRLDLPLRFLPRMAILPATSMSSRDARYQLMRPNLTSSIMVLFLGGRARRAGLAIVALFRLFRGGFGRHAAQGKAFEPVDEIVAGKVRDHRPDGDDV